MNYYILKQDDSSSNIIEPRVDQEEVWTSDKNVIFCFIENLNESSIFLEFYSRNVFLLSKAGYYIARDYQIGQSFKPYILGNFDTRRQVMYYCLKPCRIECLDDKTEFYSTGQLKKLVLNRELIGANKIFSTYGILENYLIVDFEILEKLLCAGIYPIQYQKVDCV